MRSLLDAALDRVQLPKAPDVKPATRPSAPAATPARHDARDHVSGRFISIRNGRIRR